MVRKSIQERGTGGSEKYKAIYPAILENEKIPEEEKEFSRLTDDANFLVLAGTDAPGRALVMTLYYVLRDPEVHERIRAELSNCWADASMELGLTALEQLPYFVRFRLSQWTSAGMANRASDCCVERGTSIICHRRHTSSPCRTG
jgi:cytochrome P450